MFKCEYDETPFKNYYFDLVIYHYDEKIENEQKIINELTRLSRKIIVIVKNNTKNTLSDNNFDLVYTNNYLIYYRYN